MFRDGLSEVTEVTVELRPEYQDSQLGSLRTSVLGMCKGLEQRPLWLDESLPRGLGDEVSKATSAGPGSLFWEQREGLEAWIR